MDSTGRQAYSTGTVRIPPLLLIMVASLLRAPVTAAAPALSTEGPPSDSAPPPAPPPGGGPQTAGPAPPVSNEADAAAFAERSAALEASTEPRRHLGFVQFGAALAIEVLGSSGAACSQSTAPCIFGSGGGMRIGVGYRFPGPFFVGAAYEFSKHDANKLLRLPILQQLRGEIRYLLDTRHVYEPYVLAGFGAAGYGSEWAVETLGPLAELGLGLEIQLSRTSVFGATTAYRLLWFRSFRDSAGEERPRTMASFVGIELMLEQRDPVGE